MAAKMNSSLVFVALLVCAAFVSCSAEQPIKAIPLADALIDPSNNGIIGRITNGQPAAENQFPYQAGLSLKKGLSSSWCGGSLISANWILTAAHCTVGASTVTVYLGSTVRTSPKVSVTVSSANIIQHAGYVASTLSNDISLIKIPSVTFSASIQPILLPSISSSYSTYAGNYAVASGWGRTSDSSSVASNLNYAILQVITNSVCANTYGTSVVTSNTICVSTPSGRSTCNGDSGGPLVLQDSRTLIGVTSFVAAAGCTAGYPSGFVRVTSYLDWIKANSGVSY